MYDLAKYMVLETYNGKKTIFEQGSEGDKFYFVLDGKVSIYVKAFNDMTGNEYFVSSIYRYCYRNTWQTQELELILESYP